MKNIRKISPVFATLHFEQKNFNMGKHKTPEGKLSPITSDPAMKI
jgi:hypothetical protein